ncbi:DUF2330 domain-containing protein [Polyangium mundeleinium]|uniref:DUF2330 domain-containing protein n=1 Tax=Polyangium mundeleinium TaxID=2995306 RepID=A0ABT5ENC4_9BACT|nr:DUF2330 domain-containing protein [Polyangium mundeleinium]MDC0743340.1 DUF2330 domain-containing protein [Polyangium mundeleinium]
MKLLHALFLSLPLVTAVVTNTHDAAACGGCFPPQDESTQVTGHRMIFSVSQTSTTLWDQIEYSGDPTSFAWILPIKGQVEVGLSSDAVFAVLSERTATSVAAPPLNCPPPPSCWGWGNGSVGAGGGGGAGGDAAGGGVDIITQEVVGPYETVQLSSSDPSALKTWLTTNGYNIDADIAPIIDAYVGEGFDFLALKLVPGQGVSSMRPVRITALGASNTLPLRMVGAGTGAFAPMTLWVFAEGRYETKNFASFDIKPADIVWNWDLGTSNYTTLKDDAFKAANNANWLNQYAQPSSPWEIRGRLEQLVNFLPDQSGYGDPKDGYVTAMDELQADLEKMFGGINDSELWLTRLNTELARASLNKDLALGAATAQDPISNFFQATKAIGTPPTCPEYPPCEPGSEIPGENGGSWWGNLGDGKGNGSSSASCAVSSGSEATAVLGLLGVALGLSVARRRRK